MALACSGAGMGSQPFDLGPADMEFVLERMDPLAQGVTSVEPDGGLQPPHLGSQPQYLSYEAAYRRSRRNRFPAF